MSALKARLLTNWHLARIIRLGIGIMLLVSGIQAKDWVMGSFSLFFIYQAVADTGCCGSAGCAPRTMPVKGDTNQEELTDYEEIK